MRVRFLIQFSTNYYVIANTDWEDETFSILTLGNVINLGYAGRRYDNLPINLKITEISACVVPKYNKVGNTTVYRIDVKAIPNLDDISVVMPFLEENFQTQIFNSYPSV